MTNYNIGRLRIRNIDVLVCIVSHKLQSHHCWWSIEEVFSAALSAFLAEFTSPQFLCLFLQRFLCVHLRIQCSCSPCSSCSVLGISLPYTSTSSTLQTPYPVDTGGRRQVVLLFPFIGGGFNYFSVSSFSHVWFLVLLPQTWLGDWLRSPDNSGSIGVSEISEFISL